MGKSLRTIIEIESKCVNLQVDEFTCVWRNEEKWMMKEENVIINEFCWHTLFSNMHPYLLNIKKYHCRILKIVYCFDTNNAAVYLLDITREKNMCMIRISIIYFKNWASEWRIRPFVPSTLAKCWLVRQNEEWREREILHSDSPNQGAAFLCEH